MSGWAIKRGDREVPVPDEATLLKWAAQGRFDESALIFHPDLQRWLYARDVLELRDALQQAAGAEPQSTPKPATSSPLPPASESKAVAHHFVIRQAGQEFRAPDLSTLRAWAGEGRILRDSYVFHPILKRWMYARELAELEHIYKATPARVSDLARSYRQLVLWVGVQILVSIAFQLLSSLALLLIPALIVTIVAVAFYSYRTAEALGSASAALWAVAMLIPCINILTLLVLSSKATDVCRANGIPVGFLGPRV